MYLYFNREGVLKEVVNDEKLRQGSVNVNHIYIFVEELDYSIPQNMWVKYRFPDGTSTIEIPLAFNAITNLETQGMEIPFNPKRDLKFFKYYEKYPMYEIPLNSDDDEQVYIFNALSQYGSVACTIRTESLNTLGLVVFNVEESVDGSPEIHWDEYLTLAQFNYLLSLLSTYYSVEQAQEYIETYVNGYTYSKAYLDAAFQDVREVAEGKCNTYVVSYETVAPTEETFVANKYQKPDGTYCTTWSEYLASTLGYGYLNDIFNSNNNTISPSGGQEDYFILEDLGFGLSFRIVYSSEMKNGDIILVEEVDVPDRWVSGIFFVPYFTKLETSKIDLSTYATKAELTSGLATKQNTLVSGTNIKTLTVDGVEKSLLGSGTIEVGGSGGGAWGEITGDIQDQTDLQNELTNIREVAEGKCETYILSYSDTIANIKSSRLGSGKFYVYNQASGELEDKTTQLQNGDYDNITVINGDFNSQNDTLQNVSGYLIIFGRTVAGTNVSGLNGDRIAYQMPTSGKPPFEKGDIFLVVETDVPDRWYGGGITPWCFYKLETSKIDLTTYATKTELNTAVDSVNDNIAPEYDNTVIYAIGDKVIYNGKLYTCTTAITTAESWDSTHWTAVSVASGFVDLDKAQVITGEKTFNPSGDDKIVLGQEGNSNNKIKFLGRNSARYYTLGIDANYNFKLINAYGGTLISINEDGGVEVKGDIKVENEKGLYSTSASKYIWRYNTGNGIIDTQFSICPFSSDSLDLGASFRKWKDLYLSGTAYIYDKVKLSNSSNVGYQLGNRGDGYLSIYNNNSNIVYDFDNLGLINRSGQDLGSSTYKWKDLYLSGKLSNSNSGYGLTLPDTTSYTANKTIATTDQAFNVINASDIANNNELTADQIAILTNGKPTIVSGTFMSYDNLIFFYGAEATGSYYGWGVSTDGTFAWYINKSTNIITKYGNTQTRIVLNSISTINSKSLDYYQNNVNPLDNNITTTIKYGNWSVIGVDSNTTFDLESPGSANVAEYKGNFVNTGSSSVTVTITGVSVIKCNDSVISITNGISSSSFVLPAGAVVEFNIALKCMILYNWSI